MQINIIHFHNHHKKLFTFRFSLFTFKKFGAKVMQKNGKQNI
jgi:hypothetical protein